MVEFALVAPILLLLTLTAIDFGRVYLGWVNLQQMTRIAADYAAEHATSWGPPDSAAKQADRAAYQNKVRNDAEQINCKLPDTDADGTADIPPPQVSGTTLGSHVTVNIDCEFSILTPIISNIMGGTILVGAETTYPVKEGLVALVPGGGNPITQAPVAKFVGSPQTGWGSPIGGPAAPLEVTFTDQSTGGPAAWTWDFDTGSRGGTGSGSVSLGSALNQGPHVVSYDCVGAAGDTCIFNVSLNVINGGGSDAEVKSSYVTVTVPPATGPIAEFTGNPRSGLKPLTVGFQFVDLRAGTVTYTSYAWDLNGDGTQDATGPTPAFTYTTEGSYSVTLTVTDDTGATNSLTKVGYINVIKQICTVPDFANIKKNSAQDRWTAAGFTTQIQFQSGRGNYTINQQSITGGTIDPQPNGCDSSITVGP
jgi:PKD repeat protein